jgi:hypothetical protein
MQTELEDMMLGQSASNFGNEKRISELEARLTLKESQKVNIIPTLYVQWFHHFNPAVVHY